MTRKQTWLLAILLALGQTGAAIDVPLELVQHPADARGWLPTGMNMLEILAEPPDAKLPALHHPKPIFAKMALGEARFLVVVDSDGPDAPFYNRLIVDANRNRDLTDDPVFAARPALVKGRPPAVAFPAMDLVIPVEGAERPHRLRIQAYTRLVRPTAVIGRGTGTPAGEPQEAVLVYAQSLCHMQGEVTLGERTFQVALADTNGNGIFGDQPAAGASRVAQRGDMLYITAGETFTPQDAIAPGAMVLMEGSLFTLELQEGGKGLALRAVEGELTTLHFPMRLEKLQLMREGESGPITVFDPGKQIRLPAGRYRLVSYEARRQDDGGNWWTLRASAPREGAPWVEATPGSGPALALGEPLTAQTTATPRFRPTAEPMAHLAFSLVGAGGERVTALSISGTAESKYPRSARSQSRPKEPAYVVTKADGGEVTSGSFEYG